MQNPVQLAALPSYDTLTIFSDNIAFATARVKASAPRVRFTGLPRLVNGTYGVTARGPGDAPIKGARVECTPEQTAPRFSTVTFFDGHVETGVLLENASHADIWRMQIYTRADGGGANEGYDATSTVVSFPRKQIARVSTQPLRRTGETIIDMAEGEGGDSLLVTLDGEAARNEIESFSLHYASNALAWSALPEAVIAENGVDVEIGMSAQLQNTSALPVRLAKRVKLVDTPYRPAAIAAASQQQYARAVPFGTPGAMCFGASAAALCSVASADDDAAAAQPQPQSKSAQEWEISGLDDISLAPQATFVVDAGGAPLPARAANVYVLANADRRTDPTGNAPGGTPSVLKSLVFESVATNVPTGTLNVRDAAGAPLGVARVPRLSIGDGARVDYGVAQAFSVVRTVDPTTKATENNVRTSTQRVRLAVAWNPRSDAAAAAGADVEVWVPYTQNTFSFASWPQAQDAFYEKRVEPRRVDARTANDEHVLHVFKLHFTADARTREIEVSFVERGSARG